ncbi:hypothetical protein AB0D04_07460 [Streptomyces sp. NPDC048483]|uniref:hypothetical protein n=1 Tax=Streptomyces sp. NPDC048483 TaxID=3154927 RepID=UPI00341D6987
MGTGRHALVRQLLVADREEFLPGGLEQRGFQFGAAGFTVIEPDHTIRPGTVRDEGEQVRYMDELLPVFEAEGVDSTFWFSFACDVLPHRADPRTDLDLGSFGIVKTLDGTPSQAYPGMPWEPKKAFHALARHYGKSP